VVEKPEMTFPLIRLATVDSTQSFLARHPELGFCGVMADQQTEGRGRGPNRWESPAGAGLCLSARIPVPDIPLGVILQRAMAAIITVLAPCGAELGLKWPNDLVVRKEGRLVKLGGILGEAKGGHLILGFGVNLMAAPVLPERRIPPASLAELGAVNIPEPQALALGILNTWKALGTWIEPAFRWPMSGDPIRWEDGQGLCLGWEADGRLRVATQQGLQLLSAGDVNALA
jgi:BirA family transcriptional regulator, biotin operon repressor / biotin---[acetyl-CoA-carboxylase] ligase